MKNNISLLIKENKEMKDLINILLKEIKEMKETINSMKVGYDLLVKDKVKDKLAIIKMEEQYFDRIKEWIEGDKKKINFEIIFNFNDDYSGDVRQQYHNKCNIYSPAFFIFFTEKSIFGAYCPYYATNFSSDWIRDSNAFLFSLNLNKKYPAKSSGNNYRIGCGFHFTDIEFCRMIDRKGTFYTIEYLDNYVLEGNDKEFYVKQFLVYIVKE